MYDGENKLVFPGSSAGKESTCNVEDLGSIFGLGRYPGEGNGYPLQYSGLDCTVRGMAKSGTQLSNFHFHFVSYGSEWSDEVLLGNDI